MQHVNNWYCTLHCIIVHLHTCVPAHLPYTHSSSCHASSFLFWTPVFGNAHCSCWSPLFFSSPLMVIGEFQLESNFSSVHSPGSVFTDFLRGISAISTHTLPDLHLAHAYFCRSIISWNLLCSNLWFFLGLCLANSFPGIDIQYPSLPRSCMYLLIYTSVSGGWFTALCAVRSSTGLGWFWIGHWFGLIEVVIIMPCLYLLLTWFGFLDQSFCTSIPSLIYLHALYMYVYVDQ